MISTRERVVALREAGEGRERSGLGRVAAGVALVLVPVLWATSCRADGAADAGDAGTLSDSLAAEVTVAPDALPAGEDVLVSRVVDGDTLVVADDRRVRLIGVDTPEIRHPDLGVQCYGREASSFTASLLPPGTEVRLVRDVEPFDRFDRELAYVYRRDDGAFVNAELVRQGYAQIATVPPNVRHAEELLEEQRDARASGRGLWSACAGVGDTIAEGGASDDDPSTCDPSYPDVCVPPAPPDLDCDDIDARAFAADPPDPHRLDGDGDGTACAN